MENSSQTPQRDDRQADGRHKIDPAAGIPFSATNQPPAELKRAGWAKRKRGKELVKQILELGFIGADNSKIKPMIAKYFGVDESEITVEMVMVFRQAEKAIQQNDTNAFRADGQHFSNQRS